MYSFYSGETDVAYNVVAILAAFELSCLRWGVKVSSSGSIESSGGVRAL